MTATLLPLLLPQHGLGGAHHHPEPPALRLPGEDGALLALAVASGHGDRHRPQRHRRAVDPQAVASATRADKKRLGDHTPFVLCHGPGDVRPGARIGDAELLAAVTELADGYAVGRQRVAGRHAAGPEAL